MGRQPLRANAVIRSIATHPVTERPGIRHVKAGAKWCRQRYAQATWDDRVLPDIVLAGAERCGTTALTDAIFHLPMVERPRRGKGSHYFSYNYWRGWEWFRSQFPTEAQARRVRRATGYDLHCIDACPDYIFHPFALERLAAALPDATILVMLRDPVRRAESHFHHSVAHGHEPLSFADALAAEDDRLAGETEKMASDIGYWSHAHEHHSYVSKGLYADQLRRLFGLYPRERVKVIQAEAFYRDPDRLLAEIGELVGLPAARFSGGTERNSHEYRPMDEALRARLIESYRGPNEALYELLGERYDWLG